MILVTVMLSLIASAIIANVWLVRQLEKDLSEWNRTFQERLARLDETWEQIEEKTYSMDQI
jgi:hypothetical protein